MQELFIYTYKFKAAVSTTVQVSDTTMLSKDFTAWTIKTKL